MKSPVMSRLLGGRLMEIWLPVIAISVLLLWLRHDSRVKTGLTNQPFFSWGKSPDPVKQRIDSGLRQHRRWRQTATPVSRQQIHPAYWLIGGVLALSMLGQYSTALGPSGEGTGWGSVNERNLANFPPPQQYQQVNNPKAVLTFRNGSPDALRITLTSAEGSSTLNLPGCRECKTYSRNDGSQCPTFPGVEKAFAIVPGHYHVRGVFLGAHNTRGFKSEWEMSPGWEYYQCIVTLNELTY